MKQECEIFRNSTPPSCFFDGLEACFSLLSAFRFLLLSACRFFSSLGQEGEGRKKQEEEEEEEQKVEQ
jgi:hypothetical protein